MTAPGSDLLLSEEDLQMELAMEDSVDPQWPRLFDHDGYTTSWEERQCEDDREPWRC